jgi:hypothetical protein
MSGDYDRGHYVLLEIYSRSNDPYGNDNEQVNEYPEAEAVDFQSVRKQAIEQTQKDAQQTQVAHIENTPDSVSG